MSLKLFADRGYENVSVDELVRAASVTKGAFYHYFSSKEDCLAEIHTAFVDYAFERFEKIIASDQPADLTLRALIGELIDQVHNFRDEVVLLWDARRKVPKLRAGDIESRKAKIRHLFADTVTRGQEHGVFHDSHNAQVVALGIFGMCMWAYHWYDPKGALGPHEIAASFGDLVIAGLTRVPDIG